MRYSGTHKEETRKKVVRAAAAAVRKRGPDGVGVAEVMAEAGLTHGGFYAHIPNNEALVVAAVEEAFAQNAPRFNRMTEGLTARDALATFVDAYVSTTHRVSPDGGCPVATLTSDLPRQNAPVRQAFDAGVRGMIGRIAGWLPEGTPDREQLAVSLVSEMAGAVALSRAISDDALAEALLADARRRIKNRMGIAK